MYLKHDEKMAAKNITWNLCRCFQKPQPSVGPTHHAMTLAQMGGPTQPAFSLRGHRRQQGIDGIDRRYSRGKFCNSKRPLQNVPYRAPLKEHIFFPTSIFQGLYNYVTIYLKLRGCMWCEWRQKHAFDDAHDHASWVMSYDHDSNDARYTIYHPSSKWQNVRVIFIIAFFCGYNMFNFGNRCAVRAVACVASPWCSE